MNSSASSPSTDPLLRARPTLNPYRKALRFAADRLRWDIDHESWRSRARMKSKLDGRRGERAVILCNGPSLNRVDLARLEGVFTFGLNKINLLFERSDFRPSCIVSVNELVLEQNRTFFEATDIPLFLDSIARRRRFVTPRENVTFLHSGPQGFFARDCSVSVDQGYTVTYVALQLAFHMGFSEVALVGCDHNFSSKGPANAEVASGARDDNHFDPRYFSGGMHWHLPDLAESEAAYARALRVFEGSGRRLVNATDGGQLELFPRQSLDEFLAMEARR